MRSKFLFQHVYCIFILFSFKLHLDIQIDPLLKTIFCFQKIVKNHENGSISVVFPHGTLSRNKKLAGVNSRQGAQPPTKVLGYQHVYKNNGFEKTHINQRLINMELFYPINPNHSIFVWIVFKELGVIYELSITIFIITIMFIAFNLLCVIF